MYLLPFELNSRQGISLSAQIYSVGTRLGTEDGLALGTALGIKLGKELGKL